MAKIKRERPDPSWHEGLTTFQQVLLGREMTAEIDEVGEKVTAVLDARQKEAEESLDGARFINPVEIVKRIRADIEKIF